MLKSDPLWYLIKVNEFQSISLAAEALHITQPSLSIAIKNLENTLDLKLLIRTYKGVTLTDEGLEVVRLASRAFEYFTQIEEFAATRVAEDKSMLGDIILYTNPAFADTLISCLAGYYTANSEIAFQVFDAEPDQDYMHLLLNNRDVFIFAIITEDLALPSFATYSVINKSKSFIYCSKDFSFIPPNQSSISFQELVTLPYIDIKRSMLFHHTLENKLHQYGKPNLKAIASNFSTTTAMVAANLGYSFYIDFNTHPRDEAFRYISIRNAPQFLLTLIYNKSADSDKLSFLLNELEKYFK